MIIGRGKVMSFLSCDSPVGFIQLDGSKGLNDLPLSRMWAGWLIAQAVSARDNLCGSLKLIGSSRDLELLTGNLESGSEPWCGQRMVRAGLLRQYQADIVNRVDHGKVARGLVSAPCGSGKTRLCGAIACMISKRVQGFDQPSSRWAYLVPNKELARQTRSALMDPSKGTGGLYLVRAMWAAIGGQGDPPDIRCFSPGEVWHQGLKGKRYDEFMACRDGLLYDEVHTAVSKTRSEPVLRSEAVVRIGLSATPTDRGDGLGRLVEGLFGPILSSVGIKEVEQQGFLSPGRVVG